jgi:ATP-dependent Clp protease protease subunit
MSNQGNVSKSKGKIITKDVIFDSSKFYIQYGIDIKNRRIMLDEDVDEFSIGWLVRGVQLMIDDDSEKPIDVFISSFGGSVYDGLVLYDVLEEANKHLMIRTHAIGKVMSMAFIIYLVGEERFCKKRARFMHHAGSTWAMGKPYEIKTELEELKVLETECDEIVVERTKYKDIHWWRQWVRYKDRYIGKDKAIELGIVNAEYDEYE